MPIPSLVKTFSLPNEAACFEFSFGVPEGTSFTVLRTVLQFCIVWEGALIAVSIALLLTILLRGFNSYTNGS